MEVSDVSVGEERCDASVCVCVVGEDLVACGEGAEVPEVGEAGDVGEGVAVYVEGFKAWEVCGESKEGGGVSAEAEGAEELAGAWGVVGEGEFVDFVVVCRC